MRKRISNLLACAIAIILFVTSTGFDVLAQELGTLVTLDATELVENPLHSCNEATVSEDTTLWDHVYFGSYPQSEVTDTQIIADIERVISQNSISQNEISGEPGIDVQIGDSKYRRISKSDRNLKSNTAWNDFGTATYRYFKWEPIKWKVLNNDGSNLLLITDKAIDCKSYHETEADVTWETCNLREWLNNTFYSIAFSEAEQSAIIEETLVNEDNAYQYTDGGNDTTDKIYLPTISDMCYQPYGFCQNPFYKSSSRKQLCSDYSFARGIYTNIQNQISFCEWWLRTPGENNERVCTTSNSGEVLTSVGSWATSTLVGLCPVLKIDLASPEWTLADDGSNGEGRILTGLKATIRRADYSPGATINVDDIQATATYSFCSKSYDIPLLKGTYTTNINELDMSTPGKKILTVMHSHGAITQTADITITVESYDFTDTEDSDSGENNPNINPGTGSGTNTGIYPDTGNETNTGSNSDITTGTDSDANTGNNTNTETEQNGNSNSEIKVTKLILSAPSNKLAAGKKVKLSLDIYPQNASNKEVTWQTSNKNYATVNKNGKVSLKAKGAGKKVVITALAKDGSQVEATYQITIMKHAIKNIKLKAPSKSLKAGSSMKLKATIKTTGKKANKALKWSSSNTAYATVSKSGKVKAKKAGKGKTVTIKATSMDGGNKTAKIKIKIK